MKKLFLFLLLSSPCFAAEQVDLTTPYVVDPRTATSFKVTVLNLDWNRKTIFVEVSNGTVATQFGYTGDTALSLMTALNKANLSTISLQKRILNRLIQDGYLTGTVSGSPD